VSNDRDIPSIEIPKSDSSDTSTPFGRLRVFAKPKTPDPFVNSVLTSLGPGPANRERFWISCVNTLCGSTSFLIDEQGEARAYPWPSDGGYKVSYAVAQEDERTLWLAGGHQSI
jgi:hypothetical protein